jgi:LPXTG-motif cell wall-anchored protein
MSINTKPVIGVGGGSLVAPVVTGALLPQTGMSVAMTVAVAAVVVLAIWGVSYMVMRKAAK